MKEIQTAIVKQWAKKFEDYPFEENADLHRAAQFVAVKEDWLSPKYQVVKELSKAAPPDLKDPGNPYRVLAEMTFPIYITTNYHNYMKMALDSIPNPKDAKVEYCRWYPDEMERPSIFERDSGYEPDPANPVVFHLYGHMDFPESLVLTEDDYFDFLSNVWQDNNMIPLRIQRAFTNTNLLFLGYRILDWDFRVLFSIVARYLKRNKLGKQFHIAVQFEPVDDPVLNKQKQLVRDYFQKYFEQLDIRVFWGSSQEFSTRLHERWNESLNIRPS